MQGMVLRRGAAAGEKTVQLTVKSTGNRDAYVYVVLPDGTKVPAQSSGWSATYEVPVGGTILCSAYDTQSSSSGATFYFRNRYMMYYEGTVRWYYTIPEKAVTITLDAYTGSTSIRIVET